jgi:ATP-dependent helicase/nuclease subunit B
MTGVFTIAPHLGFLDALAAGLLEEAAGAPLALARMTVFLPTRRACRSLREAFLRQSDGRPLLLPRLRAVGAADADEAEFAAEGLDLPPPIPPLRRQLLLAELVLQWGARREVGRLLPGQAVTLAGELARFLDEAASAGAPLDRARLAALVPAELARHWQEVLGFLDIVTLHWPRILEEEGCLDPASRRDAALALLAEWWRCAPPTTRIVAAGLTGGIPAIAALLGVIAGLPRGAVVLPGLDTAADDTVWHAVLAEPTHPQHEMAELLDGLGLARASVRAWSSPGVASGNAARTALLRAALLPAACSDALRTPGAIGRDAVAGLRRLDCATPQEEAGAIALMMREALTHPGKTAALVTPDRALARRVAVELARWGVEVDDSAGVALDRTPPGVFLRLVLAVAAEGLAPVPLLALLKHPLAALGLAPERCRALVRRLDRALRGPRPAPGLAGLRGAVQDDAELRAFLDLLAAAILPLVEIIAAPDATIADLVGRHVAAAEALAASADEAGPKRLWAGEAGEVAALLVAELAEAARASRPLAGGDYPAVFEALLAGIQVRPSWGRHPRLFIWGLVEARLQRADLMILGGLNEGVWPAEPASDPWLSRPMARTLGLAPAERRIGIAAHDFAAALGAGEVVLTRAGRAEGAETVPSRWLLRLDAALRAAQLELPEQSSSVLAWQAMLDRPAAFRAAAPPAPRPPLAVRPRRLSVTRIETLMRDPYSIYARDILYLRALDPLDEEPDAAARGVIIHRALERLVAEHTGALPDDAEHRLLAIGEAAFGEMLARPGVWAFWWPRFLRIARWFVAAERERRVDLAGSAVEASGTLDLAAPGGTFQLTAVADRIDRLAAGGLAIIDYKTGSLPKAEDIELGLSPQLPLEAAIARAGGFRAVPAADIVSLLHLRLSGGDPPGELKPVRAEGARLTLLVDEALRGVTALIASFDNPKTPYRASPRPRHAPRYNDYRHLARVKEWSTDPESEP